MQKPLKINTIQSKDIAVIKNDLEWMKKEFREFKNHQTTELMLLRGEINDIKKSVGIVEKKMYERLSHKEAGLYAVLLSTISALVVYLVSR